MKTYLRALSVPAVALLLVGSALALTQLTVSGVLFSLLAGGWAGAALVPAARCCAVACDVRPLGAPVLATVGAATVLTLLGVTVLLPVLGLLLALALVVLLLPPVAVVVVTWESLRRYRTTWAPVAVPDRSVPPEG
ncbi:MAG: hypothetical protein Q7T56_06670 [Nocardioidaceae bacterium]|nr:hypothetical protein [Nocardioidaceae bacterium]